MITVDQIRECIADADFTGCFKLMKAIPQARDHKFLNEIIICQQRHTRCERDKKLGLIEPNDWDIRMNKIAETLLSLCDEISTTTTKHNFHNAPQEERWIEKASVKMNISVVEAKKIFCEYKIHSSFEKQTILDYWFFDGINKMQIDEERYNSLDEIQRSNVTIIPREWQYVIWNSLKNEDGYLESCVLIGYDENQNRVVISTDINWPYTINHAQKIINWFSRSRRWLEGELVCNMGS